MKNLIGCLLILFTICLAPPSHAVEVRTWDIGVNYSWFGSDSSYMRMLMPETTMTYSLGFSGFKWLTLNASFIDPDSIDRFRILDNIRWSGVPEPADTDTAVLYYDTDYNAFTYYDGAVWKILAGGSGLDSVTWAKYSDSALWAEHADTSNWSWFSDSANWADSSLFTDSALFAAQSGMSDTTEKIRWNAAPALIANPDTGDIVLETDRRIVQVCFVDDSWTEILTWLGWGLTTDTDSNIVDSIALKDVFYSEGEIDNLLGAKSDTGHVHTQYLEATWGDVVDTIEAYSDAVIPGWGIVMDGESTEVDSADLKTMFYTKAEVMTSFLTSTRNDTTTFNLYADTLICLWFKGSADSAIQARDSDSLGGTIGPADVLLSSRADTTGTLSVTANLFATGHMHFDAASLTEISYAVPDLTMKVTDGHSIFLTADSVTIHSLRGTGAAFEVRDSANAIMFQVDNTGDVSIRRDLIFPGVASNSGDITGVDTIFGNVFTGKAVQADTTLNIYTVTGSFNPAKLIDTLSGPASTARVFVQDQDPSSGKVWAKWNIGGGFWLITRAAVTPTVSDHTWRAEVHR